MSRSTGVLAPVIETARSWLRERDRGYAATRRAMRTAILMPAMFALGDRVISNPEMAYFIAFGSFAMLLLVDFPGTIADRIRAQAALGVACVALICLATVVSRSTPLAVITMALVAFVVLFAGVVSSALAGATTTLLLAFILPVSLPGAASAIPDRVAGWGIAAAVSVAAVALLWPAPVRNPVRDAAIAACRALAGRLSDEVAWLMSGGSAEAEAAHRAAIDRAEEAVSALGAVFFATPYRPTGIASDTRAVIRLVDELRWLNTIVVRSMPARRPTRPDRAVCAVKRAAAAVLERTAGLLEDPGAGSDALHAALEEVGASLAALEQAVTNALRMTAEAGAERESAAGGPTSAGAVSARRIVSSLDPSFRAQELSFVVRQIAQNADYAAAASRRSWLGRLAGRAPTGFTGPLTSVRERAGAHLQRDSSWLHNSLRGAAALAAAVLVADVSGVQHGFWVVFGTLSVLRSNALSTGQNALGALRGTVVGFIVGGALVYAIGSDTDVLWILLPFVILFAGLAPAAISYAAGQTAFTMTLLILFNILVPAGWKVGLVRVEDIAIGCGVSLLIGVLFWPRGAAASLGRALSDAYLASARYLSEAVDYGVGRCDVSGPAADAPRERALAAAAAMRRLDDTFRGYLAERGAKPLPLAEMTGLVTGVAGVRLAADAVLDLWDGDLREGERSAARRELLSAAEHVAGWYSAFAASLVDGVAVPDALAPDEGADGRLVAAVARDLGLGSVGATVAGVKVIWTGDHLDAIRRLQESLVAPARAARSQRALSPALFDGRVLWLGEH